MTREALVSVIMPAYNAEKFIAESIQSVIDQTYEQWELLIVDDGSLDNTRNIILVFCKTDARIKYHYQSNGRQGKARNLGISNAVGDYIAFLDADDIWLPHKLAFQLKEIVQKKADLVFANGEVFKHALPPARVDHSTGGNYITLEKDLPAFLERNRVPTSTVLVKATAIRAANGFTEKAEIPQAEDYHLWLKLLLNGNRFFGSASTVGYYREHANSDSYKDRSCIASVIEVFEDLKKNYPAHRKIITKYQKLRLIHYHYASHHWNEKEYRALIRKNCSYTAWPFCNFLFQKTYSLFGFQFTRRVLNKVINNNWLV